MKNNKLGLCILAAALFAIPAISQTGSPLQVYGSMQGIFFHEAGDMQLKSGVASLDSTINDYDRNSFNIQQLDIFLRKSLSEKFTFFTDIQMSLDYSSDDNWGSIKLDQAWIDYRHSDCFGVKAGLLIPKFNRLNEYRNRLESLPYIFRPVVYETMLSDVFSQEDYVPERAFVQAYGFLPFGPMRLDYAAYVGNAESSLITDSGLFENHDDYITGTDQTSFDAKLVGGRIGFRKPDETFIAGVSATYDKDDKTRPRIDQMGRLCPAMGLIPRFRMGMDFHFNVWNFEANAELIKVSYYYDRDKYPNVDLGQLLVYGALLYNFSEDYFVYGLYQYMDDRYENSVSDAFSAGAGWRLTNFLTLKAQYVRFEGSYKYSDYKMEMENNIDFFMVGFSVLFL